MFCVPSLMLGSGASFDLQGPSGVRYSPYPVPRFSLHRDYILKRGKKGKGAARPTFQGKKFSKSIVAVDVLDEKIPRGDRRTALQHAGCIISFVDFYTHWTEEDVRDAIWRASSCTVNKGYGICFVLCIRGGGIFTL